MRRVEPYLIGGIAAWELAALIAHREWLPTWTNLVCRLPRRGRRVVACIAGAYLWAHFDRR